MSKVGLVCGGGSVASDGSLGGLLGALALGVDNVGDSNNLSICCSRVVASLYGSLSVSFANGKSKNLIVASYMTARWWWF